MLAFLHDNHDFTNLHAASIYEHGQKGIVEAICQPPDALSWMPHAIRRVPC